ncbi:MAG: TadE/TadG family type IV pilus assembly protein [Beijerinckiaceae bacterium]
MFSISKKKLRSDERGGVAILFAMSIPVIIGGSGLAIDYSQASNARSMMQGQVDAAALSGARAAAEAVIKKLPIDKTTMSGGSVNAAREIITAELRQKYADLLVSSRWLDDRRFEVTASTRTSRQFARLLTGAVGDLSVSVRAVARVDQTLATINHKPAIAHLDYEAGDYNRIYVYCFDPKRKLEADKGRRAETMTPISDNGGTTYSYDMPACIEGENLAYRLYNVRMARTSKHLWDAGNADRFNYYTDTDKDAFSGRDLYSFSRGDRNKNGLTSDFPLDTKDHLLETVLCDTLDKCDPKKPGNIIPKGKNRTPQRASSECTEGKYMYFGWEDRPVYHTPRAGVDNWTDGDFDDIRIVVECPKKPPEPVAQVRLVN